MNWITELYSPPEETIREEEEKLKEFLEHDTPSLDKGLVDLRQKFVEEEDRRRDTESKAGRTLAVSGVLLTLLNFLYPGFVADSVLILMALLLLISILLSLANLVPVGYLSPPCNQILEYSFDDKEDFTRQMYVRYHVYIYNNERVNTRRLQILRWSHYSLVLAVVLLAGVLISVPLAEML